MNVTFKPIKARKGHSMYRVQMDMSNLDFHQLCCICASRPVRKAPIFRGDDSVVGTLGNFVIASPGREQYFRSRRNGHSKPQEKQSPFHVKLTSFSGFNKVRLTIKLSSEELAEFASLLDTVAAKSLFFDWITEFTREREKQIADFMVCMRTDWNLLSSN